MDNELDYIGMQALFHARKAFRDYVEAEGFDPAYYDILFTAYVVDSNFEKRLARIEIEDELKGE